jgi:hypothetical protein
MTSRDRVKPQRNGAIEKGPLRNRAIVHCPSALALIAPTACILRVGEMSPGLSTNRVAEITCINRE